MMPRPDDSTSAQRPRRRGRLLAPVLASAGVHAVLLAALGGVTLTVLGPAPERAIEPVATLAGERRSPLPDARVTIETEDDLASDRAIVTRALAGASIAPGEAGRIEPMATTGPIGAGAPMASLASIAGPGARETVERAPSAVRFAGVGGRRAETVVFVIDVSGGAIGALSLVIDELERALATLKPSQRFAIIAFSDTRALDGEDAPVARAHADGAWLEASGDHAASAIAWMRSQRPRGRSSPLPALEAALAKRPDAVFLMTRSIERTLQSQWGEGRDQIMARLDEVNPVDARTGRRASSIFTIQLLDPDPTGILEAIAIAHGGGPDAHAVRTSAQLSAPEPLVAIERGADGAAEALDDLASRGLDLLALHGFCDESDLRAVRVGAALALSRIGEAAPARDPIAAWLAARAWTLRIASGETIAPAMGSGLDRSGAIERTRTLLDTASRDPGLREAVALERARLAALTMGDRSPVTLDDDDAQSLRAMTTPGAVLVRLALSAPAVMLDKASGILDSGTPIPPSLIADTISRSALAMENASLAIEAQRLASDEPRGLIARISRFASAGWAYASLPDEAALARVVVTNDPGEASRLLELVSSRSGYERETRVLADVELARRLEARGGAGDLVRAGGILLTLAEARGDLGDAHGWAGHAMGLAWRAAGSLGALDAPGASALHESLTRGISVLEAPGADAHGNAQEASRWAARRDLVTLRLGELADLRGALARYESFTGEHPLAGAAVASIRAKLHALAGAPGGADEAALEACASWFDRASPRDAWVTRLTLAESLAPVRPGAALEVCERLILAGAPDAQLADRLAVLAGELRARGGDDTGAFALVRPMLDRDPAPGDALLWRAWALALEIMARSDDPASVSAARAHAARLERLDPLLGGAATGDRLRGVLEAR